MEWRDGLRRAAPWVLCAVCLGTLAISSTLRWVYRDDPVDDLDWLLDAITALGFVGFPIVGALIASLIPASPIGWLWLATGLAYAVSDISAPLVRAAGWPSWVAWPLAAFGFLSLIGLLILVFLLFPDGRLPTRRWRWVARAAVIGPVLLMLAVPFIDDDQSAPTPWALPGTAGRILLQATVATVYALFALALAAMVSMVLRFRRADAIERRQLTWFLYAAVVNAAILIVDSALGMLSPTVSAVVSAAGFALVPVAAGVAMFRYRLFEIDRIVSRTVSYGLLSALLIGVYLLLVALLRSLLEPLTGSSTLSVAGSTLAVAAVFTPAGRGLQEVVAPRSAGARYDADRAVEAFAARLRDQVDIDEVVAGLQDTVVSTV